jgi:hypothetical protein
MGGIGGNEPLKLIYCCGVLEERVAEAYKHMTERAGDSILRAVLGYVADDSRKHAGCAEEHSCGPRRGGTGLGGV